MRCAADADLPEVVARREAEGYGSHALTSGNRVWVFFRNGADGHAYYRLGRTTDHGAPPIDVHELVEEWLPAMASDNVSLAVFPTPGLRGVIVSAAGLAAALRQALAEYE